MKQLEIYANFPIVLIKDYLILSYLIKLNIKLGADV